MNSLMENNQVTIAGTISKKAEYSHEIFGEKFYRISVKIPRISEFEDEIPVIISERMCDVNSLCIGQQIIVLGQFRSYIQHEEDRNHLILSVFARDIETLDEMQTDREENMIFLDGFICKEPIYRETPLGRKIADVLVAVNRPYGKSDYIPCITWGRNAIFSSVLRVGSHIQVCGRIQSREYIKKLSDTETETRIAYEVSIKKIVYLLE